MFNYMKWQHKTILRKKKKKKKKQKKKKKNKQKKHNVQMKNSKRNTALERLTVNKPHPTRRVLQ